MKILVLLNILLAGCSAHTMKRVIQPLAEFHEFPWCMTSHSEYFDNLIKTTGKDN